MSSGYLAVQGQAAVATPSLPPLGKAMPAPEGETHRSFGVLWTNSPSDVNGARSQGLAMVDLQHRPLSESWG